MPNRLTCAALFLVAVLPATACAADPAHLRVDAPYVRLAPPHAQATGAFMVIRNSGTAERKLIKADSPVAATVELHTHINENGVMKMRAVANIGVPAHGQAELKPGGFHVMLIDMKAPLKEGDNVPLTLTFDDGSTQRVDAPVRKPHDGAPSNASAHGHSATGGKPH